jgi:hypothetical protein
MVLRCRKGAEKVLRCRDSAEKVLRCGRFQTCTFPLEYNNEIIITVKPLNKHVKRLITFT